MKQTQARGVAVRGEVLEEPLVRHLSQAEVAIREAIANRGRITFREFMAMALYTAPGAYYATGTSQIGPTGDYFTSPEIHPSFGALIARQLEQIWVAMGRPEIFSVVEVGAGTGALARDIISYSARWAPEFYATIEYVILERNPNFAKRQQETLAQIGPISERVAWHSSPPGDERPSEIVRGCVLSNELLDAFPVHRVAVRNGRLREIYVDLEGASFVEVEDAPSTAALTDYFDRLGFLPPEGARVEVNLDALNWIREISRSLGRGAVITIDYGYQATDLYSERLRNGTLHCFYHHTVTGTCFDRIGRQDMTSHVDFTSLAREGQLHGLEFVGITSQVQFLSRLGMERFAALLPTPGLRMADFESNKIAIRELMDPNGLGRIRVLIQEKGLEGLDPAGLRPDGIRADDLGRDVKSEPPPLLTRSHMRLDSPPNMDVIMDTQGMWDEMIRDDEEE